jgi:hypothetical protein
MFQIVKSCGVMAASVSVAGCVPTGAVPSYADQVAGMQAASAMAGLPYTDEASCQALRAAIADPTKTPEFRASARDGLAKSSC